MYLTFNHFSNIKEFPMRGIIKIFSILIIFLAAFFLQPNNENKKIEESEETSYHRSGAMEALDFWTQARAYPDNDIPKDKLFREYFISKTKSREISAFISSGSIWDPIGPTNLQGRSLCVAINPLNPNTVFVGTASGGLWRSKRGGLGGDWQQVKLGYPALGISAIVISPVDTNTMYLGTGEVYRYFHAEGGLVLRTTRGSYGIGILKTTDGGATWTKSLDWTYNQQSGIQAMKMNPLNPNAIWAATTDGVYKTTDAGATWNIKYGALMAMDIIVHPTDTNKVMGSLGNFTSGTIIITTDGGENWSSSSLPRPSGLPYTGKTMLAMYAAHPNVIYASAADSVTGEGDLWRSTDFGTSWVRLIGYPPDGGGLYQVQGWYSHFVAVHPTDSTQIIHAAVPIYKSTNGGTQFFSVSGSYADHHGYAIHPTNPNIIYVVNDDGVYRSTNFGASYTNVGAGMQSGQIYNGFSCSATDSLIALAQSQDHIPGYRYLGNSTWDHGAAVDEAGWTAIDPSNDNIMYAVYRFGSYVYKSINRGASFNYTGSFSSGAWNSPIVISPSNPNTVYFGTTRIYKTINTAGSWSTTNGGSILDGNPALCMAMSATNPDTVFVGMAPIVTSAHIYRTTNGGTNWTNVTGTLPNRYPLDLAVDPTNSHIAYAAFGGFGTGHLFKTTDAGANWNNISGTLPDAPTTALVVDPLHPNVVYVGNDISVYVSTDGGGSWSQFGAGLPDGVIVADLTISPSNRTLRVATHGNGIWERKMLFELPADYFDYKVAEFISPTDGAMINLGTNLPSLQASFRNLSASTHPDSFDVKYRILRYGSEVFSAVKRISGLALAETRLVDFGSFSPSDTANYTLQAISLASDNNAGNDTLGGSLLVVSAPTIQNFVVTKIQSPYNEISGTAGPSGDDAQKRVSLSFPFVYDNYTYDSVQISTNGWMEFGTGSRGSLRGLSTDEQLGGYYRGMLTSLDRPAKALCPWFADLATGTGAISYTTLGITPNRTFIVQWSNVLANYDAGNTTTYLNFQIKLYETTNIIEFSYGPLLAGAFPSGATGASIGMKDYIGGDYRIYDVTKYNVCTMGDMNVNLNPLTDWPGEDNAYVITTNVQGTSVALTAGWNLVSTPVTRSDYSTVSIFPNAIGGYSYLYAGTYLSSDSILPGTGYWIKTSGGINQFIQGSAMPTVSAHLLSGWNIIGSVDHETSAPTGGIIVSDAYTYTDTGYTPVTTLKSGYGYWVKADANGTVVIGSVAEPKTANLNQPNVTLIITDKLGRSRRLYLTDIAKNQFSPGHHELPPPPPGDLFDARFQTQQLIEGYTIDNKCEQRYPVRLQSPAYPLKVTCRFNDFAGKNIMIEEVNGNNITAKHTLTADQSVMIEQGDAICISIPTSKPIPSIFSLYQNYPNPFNPTTTISFDLPVQSNVRLILYDIVGKKVADLVDGEYEAGSHSLRVDFSSYASGVYFYRLTAGTFSQVKKLVFAK
jgi:photosystem II stability/assembly factor-like uncharacterized protein